MTNFKKYLQNRITSFSPVKSLFTNLINNLGGRRITINLLRKRMPESLRVVLAARKRLQRELNEAVLKDTKGKLNFKTNIKENHDLYDNDKINYNEGMSFHGFMMTLPMIWFIFILILVFGEEKHRKIMDFITEKGDKLFDKIGINDFDPNENK